MTGFVVTSLVASKTGLPRVNLRSDEGGETQMSAEEARQLAFNLLGAAEAADGDAFLYRFVQKRLGVEATQAGAILLMYRHDRMLEETGNEDPT